MKRKLVIIGLLKLKYETATSGRMETNMKKNFKTLTVLTLILSLLAFTVTGCAKTKDTSAESTAKTTGGASENDASATDVTVVKAVTQNNYYPLAYLDESGELVGYAIDVAKLIDEALPQYEFNIEPSSGDAILLGLESGTYDVAIGGYYWNAEREEKFIYPDFSGGGIVGVVVRNENADVKNLSYAATQGLKVAPTLAGGGIIGVLKEYNEANPDNLLNYETIETRTEADIWKGVLDGRYDVDVANKHTWNKIIATEGQEAFKDGLTFSSFTVVKSYDLFNKDQQVLVDAYNAELAKLKEDGTLSELSIKWFGEDLFLLITDDDK